MLYTNIHAMVVFLNSYFMESCCKPKIEIVCATDGKIRLPMYINQILQHAVFDKVKKYSKTSFKCQISISN